MKNAFFLHSSRLSCTSLGSTNPTWEMTGIEKTAHLTMVVTALLSCLEPGITNPALGQALQERSQRQQVLLARCLCWMEGDLLMAGDR